MLAAVASESLPYTDPRAGYPTAVAYRATRGQQPVPAAPARRRADDDRTSDQM